MYHSCCSLVLWLNFIDLETASLKFFRRNHIIEMVFSIIHNDEKPLLDFLQQLLFFDIKTSFA